YLYSYNHYASIFTDSVVVSIKFILNFLDEFIIANLRRSWSDHVFMPALAIIWAEKRATFG
ncbi:hypothetical protein ACV67C_002250, partial [Salmonella enterica]